MTDRRRDSLVALAFFERAAGPLLVLTASGRPSLAADVRRAFAADARVSAGAALALAVLVLRLVDVEAVAFFLCVRAEARWLPAAIEARILCGALLALPARAGDTPGGAAGAAKAGVAAASVSEALEPAAGGALSISAAGVWAIVAGTDARAFAVDVDVVAGAGIEGNTPAAVCLTAVCATVERLAPAVAAPSTSNAAIEGTAAARSEAAAEDGIEAEAHAGSAVIACGTGRAAVETGAVPGRKPHQPAAQASSATIAAPAQVAARCAARCGGFVERRWPGISGSGSCHADATIAGSRAGARAAASRATAGWATAAIGSLTRVARAARFDT